MIFFFEELKVHIKGRRHKIYNPQNGYYKCFHIKHAFWCVKETSPGDVSFTHQNVCFIDRYLNSS